MTRAKITAVGGWVPEDVLTNQYFEKIVDTTDEWIKTRTGIEERRILKGEGKGTSFMAVNAVNDLLERRGIAASDIDLMICATITPDMFFPNTSNFVSDALGIHGIPSFDVSAACSGFIYAIETGSNFIKSGNYKKVVVIGADKMTSITDYEDRNNCILFGDGAAAILLEPTEEDNEGIIDSIIRSDAIGKDFIYLKAGGSAYPASESTVKDKLHYFHQDGKSVFKYAVTSMADVSEEIMKRNSLEGEDIAWLVPHQANKRIIEATANRMDIGMDKVTMNIHKYGNTTAATIPLCLWEWQDKFNKGDNIVLASFGAGFTWGAIYLKWAV